MSAVRSKGCPKQKRRGGAGAPPRRFCRYFYSVTFFGSDTLVVP